MVLTAVLPTIKKWLKTENEEVLKVNCPHKKVLSKTTSRRFKADFSNKICGNCPFKEDCKLKQKKNERVFYFTKDMLGAHHRIQNIMRIPKERRKIRPNVEATIMSMAIKFGRIDRLKVAQ